MPPPSDDAPPGFGAPARGRADDGPPPGFGGRAAGARATIAPSPPAGGGGWWAPAGAGAPLAPHPRHASPALTPSPAANGAVPFPGGRRKSDTPGFGRASPAPRAPPARPHWTPDAVAAALVAGTAFTGTVRVGAGADAAAYVGLPGLPADVMLRGALSRNRCIDGDVVCITLRPEREWWVRRGGGTPAPATPAPVAADAALAERAARDLASLTVGSEGEEDAGGAPEASAAGRRALASVAARLAARPDARTTADVVAVVSPSRRRARWVGTLEAGAGGGLVLRPTDARLPPGAVDPGSGLPPGLAAALTAEALLPPDAPRTLLLAAYGAWAEGAAAPAATVARALGRAGDLAAETAALLAAEAVDAGDFGEAALAELPALPWSVGDAELARRVDLRGRRIFSIDPPTARDLDDALSVDKAAGLEGAPPGAVWRVGVHIAGAGGEGLRGRGGGRAPCSPQPPPSSYPPSDVSAFVPAHGALDAAGECRRGSGGPAPRASPATNLPPPPSAASRATSTYLVTSVVPMLPRVLCESLCSLEPGAARLAFSCEWWVDARGGAVGGARFYRSVIRSVAKLAYGDAQAMLDAGDGERAAAAGREAFDARRAALPDGSRPPPVAASWTDLAADTRALWALARARRAARFGAGALRLDNTKLIFRLAPDGAPTSAHAHVHGEANQLVEEWMLAANGAAAERLASRAPTRALLRRHPPPAQSKLEEVAAAVKDAVGVTLDVSSAGALHASLTAAAATLPPAAAAALTLLCTKPMQLATYDCAGAVAGGVEAMGHYALAMRLYTHFTSPIRRYPDVLVHRMLAATLDGGSDGGAPSPPCDDDWWHARGVAEPAAVAAAAAHCNERKLAAKAVQDASSKLFLADLVRRAPRVAVAVATSVGGSRFLDCHIPALGVDVRVSVEDAVAAGEVVAGWDGGAKALTLREGGGGGGGGGVDTPPPRPLHNPDNLPPLTLPVTITLLASLTVVVTAVGGGRGGGATLTATLLVQGAGMWATAGDSSPVDEGALGIVDDLAGAD